MRVPEQYEAAEALERHLGDPRGGGPLSWGRAVELDEAERYPEEACAALDRWGLGGYYVPGRWGGRLRSFEELIALLRVVARRNLSVIVAHAKSFLGSVNVWAGGSEEQRERMAGIIKGGQQVALAYHEKAHGGDLLATEVRAVRVAGGYRLSGEKWLVNNATRGAALTVFARTAESGGPRGVSLFLVEKEALDPRSFEHLPRVKTLGVRGVDFSGIVFRESFVGEGALIGAEGSGLEQTLRAFQLTRTVIPALSLGAADTALRSTLDFALKRTLYGARVSELGPARRALVGAFLDLLIGDCLTVACARALHQTPEQMRLYSAVVKYLVPHTLEETIESLGVVLGARHYLREGHWHGIFQKLLRDIRVLSIFHAGPLLNLTTIGVHLRDLARHRARTPARDDTAAAELDARLGAVFDLRRPLADFDPDGLSLYTRGRDDFLDGLDAALARLRQLAQSAAGGGSPVPSLVAQAERVLALRQAADDEQREVEARLGRDYSRSPEMFEQAERYCLLEAAACCLHLWLHNREHLGEFFGRGDWLALCLERILKKLGERGVAVAGGTEGRVWGEMVRLYEGDRMFSAVPFRLARAEAANGDT